MVTWEAREPSADRTGGGERTQIGTKLRCAVADVRRLLLNFPQTDPQCARRSCDPVSR
jgi:hypothetical protein